MPDALTDDQLVFGHAVVLIEVGAYPILPFTVSRFAQRLAGCMSAAKAAEIVRSLEVGHGKQPAVNGGDGMKHRYSVSFDAAQNVFRGRAVAEDRCSDAIAQGKQQVVTEGANEAPLSGGHYHVIVLRWQPVAVQIAEGNDPAMRVDDAFGFAGGARSVDDESWFVGRGLGGPDVCTARFQQRCKRDLAGRRITGAHDVLE